MDSTQIFYIIIAAIIGIVILAGVYLSGRFRASMSDSGFSVSSEKKTKTRIEDVSSSTVDVRKKTGDDTSIRNVKNNSTIKVK